ncbi:hypothetical protein RJ639_024390 [Escallonia herrerae]|uniref:ENT domain-containing protein n=1 Tax=Escallonia herrerae TaxID=1293975 RepID=A0AA88V029_9ASTE|nr:hypothetical protein RJ639_024390 [Escallonia herrerae]
MYSDLESQIHYLEKEAYGSVLRAFGAQSDALTWDKEALITELRKELRVSDDEHRDLLTKVNGDDVIRRIRECRKASGNHSSMAAVSQPSPTVSGSRKRQKTNQMVPLQFGTSHAINPRSGVATSQPPSSAAQLGPGGNMYRHDQPRHGLSPRYPSTGPNPRGQAAETRDPLIGRKVMTRWPADNNFYEAIISDYNHAEGRHALTYDRGTARESYEWVDLKEIPSEDIRWVDEDPRISRQSVHGEQGCRFPPLQNGDLKKASNDIEIPHTDTLIKEVEKVFGANNPDPFEIEKAKKLLKEQEQLLIDVIAKLADAYDSGSDGEPLCSHGQSMDREEQGRRDALYSGNQCGPNIEAEIRGGRAGGSMLGV